MSGSAALLTRRHRATHLHPRPGGGGCRAGCSAGTAGCAHGRRRASPRRSRRARRRSTGTRREWSAAGSRPAPQSGTIGGYGEARSRAVHDERVRGASETVPPSSTISSRVTRRMWPRRTTRSIVRSSSSSHTPSVGVLAIVGMTSRSTRSITPAASRRRKRSSSDSASRRGRHRVGGEPQRHDRVGLHDGAVEHPRIARAHPGDAIGIDPVGEQPHDPVGRRLARADDHVADAARRRSGRAR